MMYRMLGFFCATGVGVGVAVGVVVTAGVVDVAVLPSLPVPQPASSVLPIRVALSKVWRRECGGRRLMIALRVIRDDGDPMSWL